MRIQNLITGLAAASVAVFAVSCSQPAATDTEAPAMEEAVEAVEGAVEEAAEAVEEAAEAVEAVAVPEGFEAIESSLVKGAKYDAASETLELVLTGGKTYQYTGVAQKVYDDFMAADSKGSFYTANIKGKFGAPE